jgi:hypothetical protein
MTKRGSFRLGLVHTHQPVPENRLPGKASQIHRMGCVVRWPPASRKPHKSTRASTPSYTRQVICVCDRGDIKDSSTITFMDKPQKVSSFETNCFKKYRRRYLPKLTSTQILGGPHMGASYTQGEAVNMAR